MGVVWAEGWKAVPTFMRVFPASAFGVEDPDHSKAVVVVLIVAVVVVNLIIFAYNPSYCMASVYLGIVGCIMFAVVAALKLTRKVGGVGGR